MKHAFVKPRRDAAAQGNNLDNERSDSPDEIGAAFLDEWDNQLPDRVPTGIAFIDEMLGGGPLKGQVIGILGPCGSCKTTLAVMLSTIGARRALANSRLHRQEGRPAPIGIWYHFSYDERIHELRWRAASFCGQIKNLPGQFLKRTPLSSCVADLKPYEKVMFAEALCAGAPIESETDRRQRVVEELNMSWRVIDMTDYDSVGRQRGGSDPSAIVPLVRADLAKISATRPCFAGGIVVDYVGAAVNRAYAEQFGETYCEESMRALVNNWVPYTKEHIATPLQCPVFLFHNLAFGRIACSPSRIPRLEDADKSRTFGRRLDHCFAIGAPNENGRAFFDLCYSQHISRPKTRVIEIRGDLCEVVEVKGPLR